ncbi:MAG: PAS domain S-box protein [Thermoanaerobaculia bacterium]|nr:PAS domain S-box protein [Thermoanaerobaculia bacterium]
MKLREQFQRRRKDTRFILRMLGLLLLLLSGLYFLLLRSRDLPDILVTNRVLLFVLWYIDAVLILAILFVLARSVFKLLLERRHKMLGSKFKSKLVATYIGLSLIPVLVLFLYATQLLQQSVDRWFATPVREVVQQGSNIAQTMLQELEANTLRDAQNIAGDLDGLQLADPATRPDLDRRLRRALRRSGLDVLAVYRGTDFLHGMINPQSGLTGLPEPERALLVQAALDGKATRILAPSEQGRLILAAASVSGDHPLETRPLVVGARVIAPAVARQSQDLIQAYQSYRQLELQKAEITASQLLLFLMITLLVLLASSWVGLYLARRVTVPIQALVEGTRIIRTGDLTYRVKIAADDELGVLVDSFNRMTGALERGRQNLTEANRRLDAERALLEAILHSIAAGVIALDVDDAVVLSNDAALRMLGQDFDDLRNRSIHEVWQDPERGKLLPLLDGAGEGRSEVKLVLRGSWKTFEVHVTPMHDGEEGEVGKVIVLEDLTELIQAQQLAAWSDAARRIAHEIKNPLTPIRLAAERLTHRYRQQPEDFASTLEEGVSIIIREVETLKGMVDEFSRFARMPQLHATHFDLDTLVDEIVRLYQGLKPGVDVVGHVAPEAQRAWGDPEQIKGVLINLLDNAIQATDDPGRVSLTATASDTTLRLAVADNGRGISPEAKGKLFLPHFSTKGRGTGLGLAIVHRIVSTHQGTVHVEDNEPKGSVFVIVLPMR